MSGFAVPYNDLLTNFKNLSLNLLTMLTAILNDFETYELIFVLLFAIFAPRTKDTALVLLIISMIMNSIEFGFSIFDLLINE